MRRRLLTDLARFAHRGRYLPTVCRPRLFIAGISVDGKRMHRTIGRESDGTNRSLAEQWIEKRRIEAREGRLALPKGRKTVIRFDEASDRYLKQLVEEGGNDVKAKRWRLELHLTPYFKSMPLTAITVADVERYKRQRLDEVAVRGRAPAKLNGPKQLGKTKPGTVNRELAVLRHLLGRAVEWGWIPHLPCKIKLLKDDAQRVDYLTIEECGRLLESAACDPNPQTYAFILIGLESSMRRSEILSIRRENIDFDARTIFLSRAKAGPRKQPITERLVAYLRGYIATLPSKTPWLFPSPTARSGHTTDIRKAFCRAVRGAGLDPVIVVRHTLRHTAITHLCQARVDLPTVAVVSGHKTLKMVLRYAHAETEHVQDALDKLEARYRQVPKLKEASAPQYA